MSLNPRPHQVRLISDVRAALASHDRVLLTGATGIGKTTMGMMIAEGVARKGTRALFCVHRVELLEGLIAEFSAQGIAHGIIAAGYGEAPSQHIQLAMIDTLRHRLTKLTYRPDLLVVDEAAHAACDSWSAVIGAFTGTKVVGLTACPLRLDGRGLGRWFGHMVVGPQTGELIEGGWLSPFEVWGAVPLDLTGVKTKMGEFDQAQIEEIMSEPTITGNALKGYQDNLPGKRALGFAVSVKHSQILTAAFVAAGVPAAHVDGTTPKAERLMNMAAFRQGTVKVLLNVGLFGEGVDVPLCDGVLDLNPTKSLSAYLQRFGRLTRPVYATGLPIGTADQRKAAIAAGPKPVAKYLDFAGNCLRHDFPDTLHQWTLEDRPVRKRGDVQTVAVRQCPECYYIHRPAPSCPECGSIYEITPREVKQRDGELVKMQRKLAAMQAATARKNEERMAKTVQELIALGRKRGYQYPEAWAYKRAEIREKYRRRA